MTVRASSSLALIMLALVVLATIPDHTHSVPQSSTILGWGCSRLVESTVYSNTTIPSIVFPFENASDQEVIARRIVEMGLNTIRISFAPYCTNPNGFMSPYNSTRLGRAIRIGETLGIWMIIDYHGYEDMSNSTVAGCWLGFWRTVLTNFSSSYERIVWEPLNEPMNINGNVTLLGNYYQDWINQARSVGDTHWIVVQNLCSYGCSLCPSGNGDCPAAVNGYPRVTDPLGHIFISLHTYMSYKVYHNSWNNTAAEDLARNYYFTMINGTSLTGFPILNTEGGPGPIQRTFTNGTKINCPDLVTTGAAGYCTTNLHFIKTLTALPEGGYKFRAWRNNVTGLPTVDHAELLMSADQNLVAVFSPISHDVAAENLNIEGSLTISGPPIQVVVTARNLGDVAETFNVTFYCNNTNVGSQLVRNLGNGSSVNLLFSWDTTGLRPDTYLLEVAAGPVPGETALANNNLTIAVNLSSHANTNTPTALLVSLGTVIFMGTAGCTTIIVGLFLARRRLQ